MHYLINFKVLTQIDLSKISKQHIVIKYGGHAMTNAAIRNKLIAELSDIYHNFQPNLTIVHGGGPFIKKALQEANIDSQFFEGHRITTPEAMDVVEKALKGEVNGALVSEFIANNVKAVGISGKDGGMIQVEQRKAMDTAGKSVNLGRVGDVSRIDNRLLNILLNNKFLPVIACLGADNGGLTYNVNADMLAGAIAGSLKAHYFTLTDVDGLFKNINLPESKIDTVQLSTISEVERYITGGMLPKVEGCKIAIETGARSARIINGTKEGLLRQIINNSKNDIGTNFIK